MDLIINSPVYGTQAFSCRCDDGYIRLWDEKKHEMVKICKGGGFTGIALKAKNENDFNKKCRRWWINRRADLRFENEISDYSKEGY